MPIHRTAKIKVLALLFLGYTFVACATNNASATAKSDWLQKAPCAAPCWENITAGVTSNGDAVKSIKANPLIDSSTIATQKEDTVITLSWNFRSDNWQGKALYISGDPNARVQVLTLVTPDLCLKDIAGAYGNPDLLFLTTYTTIGEVDLIWKSNGFAYSAELGSPNQEITENTCGGSVIYFPIGTPFTKIPGIHALFASEDQFVPWKGYGKY